MASYPVYPAEEARFRRTFLVLMWALSYPGRTQVLSLRELTGDNHDSLLIAVAETLLDHEAGYFTTDPALEAQLCYTQARALPANRAAYHFYPRVSPADLYHIEAANRDSALYPDQPATLCLGCARGSINSKFAKTVLTLQEPGFHKHNVSFAFSGIPGTFWSLREQRNAEPTGWDIFLIDADGKLIGIPRTIHVEIERLGE